MNTGNGLNRRWMRIGRLEQRAGPRLTFLLSLLHPSMPMKHSLED